MRAGELLHFLGRNQVRMEAHGDRLLVDAPNGVLTEGIVAALLEHKLVVLEALRLAGPSKTIRWDHLMAALDSNKPAAPETVRPTTKCWLCGSNDWWRHASGGNWLCGRCHPNPQEMKNDYH